MQNVGSQLDSRIKRLGLALCLLVLAVGWGAQRGPAMAQETPPPAEVGDVQAGNLLLNGSFEDGFYKKYPNHYVAHNWLRWWIDGSNLPEYDDTRDARPHYDGNKAQVQFIWGKLYEAGIYQVVGNVNPCSYYQLNAYLRNHSVEDALPHARIGIDPTGTQLTEGPSSGAVDYGLPWRTVWSAEQTHLFTWEQFSVATEAQNTQITAIFYARPQPVRNQTHYFDTYWDAASLYALPYPGERLPNPTNDAPTTAIANLTTNLVSGTLTVTWETASPAHSQLWYNVISPTVPITPSATMTYTSYMPIIALHRPPAGYREETPLNAATPTTQHAATITNLPAGGKIEFFAVARQLEGDYCQTRISDKALLDIGDSAAATDRR